MFRSILLLAVFLVSIGQFSQASVIELNNGDHVRGEVVEDADLYLRVKTELLGEINIQKEFIKSVMSNEEMKAKQKADALAIEKDKAQAVADAQEKSPAAPVVVQEPPAPKIWSHNISAGYTTTNGNTKTSAFNITTDSQYAKGRDLWKIKNIWDYASNKGKMTTQKYFGKAQSDYRLGVDSKWFNTRAVEVTHDRFASIDYRVLPSTGIGYWFWEGDDSKFETDLSIGYEYTKYNTPNTKATGNFTLIPHLFIDKVLFGKSKISQDLTMYPSLEDAEDYRLRSETAYVNPISDTLSWKISFIDEFNSSPKGNAKKNDTTFMSSLQVAF